MLKELTVPEILLRTKLVTVPVIKTQNKTVITGAIKNQWGCLPMFRDNDHLVLDAARADINTVARPCFAMMDATIGLEGNSPKSGKPATAHESWSTICTRYCPYGLCRICSAMRSTSDLVM